MNMKKIIIAILLIIPLFVEAQTNNNLPPKKFYKTGTVTLTNFDKIECKDLNICADSLTFNEANTGKFRSVLISEVGSIRVKSGNNSLPLAVCGAAVFGASAISNFTYVPAILGFAFAGAGTGALIGLFIPKTKLYRINY